MQYFIIYNLQTYQLHQLGYDIVVLEHKANQKHNSYPIMHTDGRVESFWHNVPRWKNCGSSIFRITEVNTIYMQSSHAVKIHQMPIFQHSIMNHASGS